MDEPILHHRDGNLLILESKVWRLWSADVSEFEIAAKLGIAGKVVAEIVARCAPQAKPRIRRGR